MPNTRFSGGMVIEGGIYAAGTTNFPGQTGSAATALPTGQIKAAGSIKGLGPIVSTTFMRAGTGFVFAGAGDVKQFAQGTYIGTGAATAAIIATGLTTVDKVWMNYLQVIYPGGGTSKIGRTIFSPVQANGTPGSFYPLVYRSTATNKNITLGTGFAATFNWFATGRRTVTV